MKIALCATELETDAVSAFLNIASYLHMVEKKSDAAMVLFPLRRFQEKDWKESLKSLRKLSENSSVPFGVGFQEKGRDVYALFLKNEGMKTLREAEFCEISLCGQAFVFAIGDAKIPESLAPVIRLDTKGIDLQKPPFGIAFQRETYYLGISGPKYYQAAVYRDGVLKCHLPEDHPNLLVKTLFSFSSDEPRSSPSKHEASPHQN